MSGLSQAVALSLVGLASQAVGLFAVYGHGAACIVVGSEILLIGAAAVAANVRAVKDVR